MSLLRLDEVTRSVQLPDDETLEILKGVTLEVEVGDHVSIVGRSGSGKSTLLNLLGLLDAPTSGSIWFDDRLTSTLSGNARDRARGADIGFIFQQFNLLGGRTALENVMIGAQREGNPLQPGHAALRERALSALGFVGMADRANVIVKNLPYGHQRLVEIARALAGHPKLLLLDEPAAGLNLTEKQELVALLKRLRGHGLTIFLIEHDMGLIQQVSDRISVLNFGKKIAEGTPEEVLRHPEVIKAYLGEDAHGAA